MNNQELGSLVPLLLSQGTNITFQTQQFEFSPNRLKLVLLNACKDNSLTVNIGKNAYMEIRRRGMIAN